MDTYRRATKFFEFWVDACAQRHDILLRDWPNAPVFTSHVLSEPDSIIQVIARGLKMECYCGYYSIDAILFTRDDLVPAIPVGTTWVRRIRVAFEHENYFHSGLFQEVSHLLITDCDLRVVVSYPAHADELRSELHRLHRIIADTDRSDQVADTGAFLFIAGWRDVEKGRIEWWGHLYQRTQWERLASPTPAA